MFPTLLDLLNDNVFKDCCTFFAHTTTDYTHGLVMDLYLAVSDKMGRLEDSDCEVMVRVLTPAHAPPCATKPDVIA